MTQLSDRQRRIGTQDVRGTNLSCLGANMFEGLFQPMHLLVIVGIALLVFGPKKLPELGKGIGEGIRGFKAAINNEEKPASTTTTSIANDRIMTGG